MKKITATILQTIIFIFGIQFVIIDYFVKNEFCEWVINSINDACFDLEEWSGK